MSFNRVYEYLKGVDPSLEPYTLNESTRSSLEAANALGVEVGQIAKSILFRAGESFGLFVTAGDVKVDLKVVKASLHGKPYMATADEVQAVTGFPIGGVCPFALQTTIPIFLDSSMRRFSIVYTAAGTANSVLPITFERLQQITDGVEIEIAKKMATID